MPEEPTATTTLETPAPPPALPPDPATAQAVGAGTAVETVTREEHQRELDRYRNEVGQAKRAQAELEKRLRELETANQTEAERLAAKAKRADELEPELAA